jgi:hypothetical protein
MNLKLIDFGLSFKWHKSMREELIEKGDNKLVGTVIDFIYVVLLYRT